MMSCKYACKIKVMTNPTSSYDPFAHLADCGAKICGIRTRDDYVHCVEKGAAFIGMVFFEKSPRHLSWDDAIKLAEIARPNGPIRVALTVNADDDYLEMIYQTAKPDMFQLHGDETPQRARQIKQRYNLPVMKALRVQSAADVKAANDYIGSVDWLLFDAFPANPDLPGGTGHQFDWQLVAGLELPVPWMLAGGLSADSLQKARIQTGARYFDVSSAVEGEKGVKNHEKISAFIEAAC